MLNVRTLSFRLFSYPTHPASSVQYRSRQFRAALSTAAAQQAANRRSVSRIGPSGPGSRPAAPNRSHKPADRDLRPFQTRYQGSRQECRTALAARFPLGAICPRARAAMHRCPNRGITKNQIERPCPFQLLACNCRNRHARAAIASALPPPPALFGGENRLLI